jgi:carbamoyltransferase
MNPESKLWKLQLPFLENIMKKSMPKELRNKPIKFVNHHLSHASAAYFNSGKKEALIISADCWGDGTSFAAYNGRDGKLKRLYQIPALDSFGHFYSLITKHLGFKPFKHEGKITGLSAHGNKDDVKIEFPFREVNGKIKYTLPPGLDPSEKFKKELEKYSREDISAWLQENMTDTLKKVITQIVEKSGMENVLLVGGLFANVRFNQMIKEIPGVNFVYVFPEMGDGGLSVGGSCYVYSKENLEYSNNPKRLENVYLGAGFGDEEIEEELKKFGIEYEKKENIEKEIARLISEGKVVARFNGRMEFGPRALGNRSILYHAKDPKVNDWLNARLKRTEFMPFAPATMFEYRDKCYKDTQGAEFAARFMTITFDCTDYMKKNSPAAVHIDGTARPQLVREEDNPSFYNIIKEYHKLTKIPTIINTSFNMHEEPIVRSPEDAIRAFQDGDLDYLAIGSFLVKNK